MIGWLFWLIVGLIVGWNFLPQPKWVKSAVDSVVTWVKGFFGGKSE